MNARSLIAGLLVAGLLLGAVLFVRRSSDLNSGIVVAELQPPSPPPAPAPAALEVPGGSPPVPAAAAREAPGGGPPGRAVARTTQEPPAQDTRLEAVEPMLELNLVRAGGETAGSSGEESASSIDELLSGKHAGKTKDQLERS